MMVDERMVTKVLSGEAIEDKNNANTKKGISVTRALVLMGFDSWVDLEPGNFITKGDWGFGRTGVYMYFECLV